MAEFRPFWNGLLSQKTGFTKSRSDFPPLLQDCTSKPLWERGFAPRRCMPDAIPARAARSPRVTDQTALSFASETAPADGVAVVFAEEGGRLSPAAKDLDKKS
jgi:hypothetical protein